MTEATFFMVTIGGSMGYIITAFQVYHFLEDKLDWDTNDPGAFFCSIGWPIFLSYWLIFGWPVMLIIWLLKRLRRTVKGLHTVSREVK